MRLRMWLRVVVVVVVGAAVCSEGSFEEDREALVSLYLSLGGSTWTNNDNWSDVLNSTESFDLSTWYGVTTANETGVTRIDLDDNNLVGEIPPEIGSIPVLAFLGLDSNSLTGIIPPELGRANKLAELYLNDNNLEGPIPPEIGNLSRLSDLDLSGNSLSELKPTDNSVRSWAEWLLRGGGGGGGGDLKGLGPIKPPVLERTSTRAISAEDMPGLKAEPDHRSAVMVVAPAGADVAGAGGMAPGHGNLAGGGGGGGGAAAAATVKGNRDDDDNSECAGGFIGDIVAAFDAGAATAVVAGAGAGAGAAGAGAGALVEALVGFAEDHRSIDGDFDKSRRLCLSLVPVLEKGERLLANESSDGAGSVLMKCVQDDLKAMVDMMNYYQSRRWRTRLWKATLYKKRHEEAEKSVDKMLAHVNPSLQPIGRTRTLLASVGVEVLRAPTGWKQRRKELIAQEELPSDCVEISDDLIGSGGSGEVYMADFGGLNAAAKVTLFFFSTRKQGSAFLVELQHMRRLKSPHIVNVFGIITSIEKRLVLVSRRIIRDIAEGMSFLHRKKTWHGDLKSLNVLLDANDRAKISDFGTSHCTEQTKSRNLQTGPASVGWFPQMSYQWAAPELLEASGHSSLSGSGSGRFFREPSPTLTDAGRFMGDVYSFGMIVWEVLSTQPRSGGASEKVLGYQAREKAFFRRSGCQFETPPVRGYGGGGTGEGVIGGDGEGTGGGRKSRETGGL
eukprot:jgi/Undpi1/12997/HiC_scaffold_7.g02661.m1